MTIFGLIHTLNQSPDQLQAGQLTFVDPRIFTSLDVRPSTTRRTAHGIAVATIHGRVPLPGLLRLGRAPAHV